MSAKVIITWICVILQRRLSIESLLYIICTLLTIEPSCFVPNSNYVIGFEKNLTISHCTYCTCQYSSNSNITNEKPQVDCYTTQDRQTFQEICENCATLPSTNCSYCLQPNNRSSNELTLEGQVIRTGHENCVACTCNEGGVVSCSDLDTSTKAPVCQGINQCEQKLNELSENSCQYCEDPMTGLLKSSPSTWTKESAISCTCFFGQVSCFHFKLMFPGGGSYTLAFIVSCENCTTDNYELVYNERGRFELASIHITNSNKIVFIKLTKLFGFLKTIH